MRKFINSGADALILGVLLLSAILSICTAMSVYPLNSYWIELLSDYSGGFVRRFLLGEILNNIPGVTPEIAGIAVLAACYAFVTLSLYSEMRRLSLPLFLRVLVLLSPFGVPFYIMVPTAAEHFLLRDILIIALVILAAKTVCLFWGKADVRAHPALRCRSLRAYHLRHAVPFRNFILHSSPSPDVPWNIRILQKVFCSCSSARYDFPGGVSCGKPGFR